MDRPIIFSAPMIKALLAGRKTQTRRLLKEQPPIDSGKRCVRVLRRPLDGPPEHAFEWRSLYDAYLGDAVVRFAVGDRLWVKENHRLPKSAEGPAGVTKYGPVFYEADQHWYLNQASVPGKLRPSIHMPRWASRMTLLVTDVRVERLQDISETDAKAEGADGMPAWGSHRNGFHAIWLDINGHDSWQANPWVVAVSFTKHGAIDSMTSAA
jgi:hypothetical protein